MNDLSTLLQDNPVFSILGKDDTELMIQQARRHTYSKDETVILYGDVWPHIFLVGEGKVEALKESSDGRSLHVVSFSQGELFWGLAFFHEDAPMPVTLEAREKSVLYLWTRDSVLPIIPPQRTGILGNQPPHGGSDAARQQSGGRAGFSSCSRQAGTAIT